MTIQNLDGLAFIRQHKLVDAGFKPQLGSVREPNIVHLTHLGTGTHLMISTDGTVWGAYENRFDVTEFEPQDHEEFDRYLLFVPPVTLLDRIRNFGRWIFVYSIIFFIPYAILFWLLI
jgi:hypothetical protein